MARLWSSGGELNSVGILGSEWTESSFGISQSSIARSGTYALRFTNFSSGSQKFAILSYTTLSTGNTGPFYVRVYFRVNTLPTAENRIFVLLSSNFSSTSDHRIWITIDNTGALRLYDDGGAIGSPSSPLSTATWHCIELMADLVPPGGSEIVRARLNGVEFAGATNRGLLATLSSLMVGGNLNNEAQTTGDWYFDDIAVNDNTGSYQNSWPGEGKIIHLKPNAAGDNNQLGSASSNNYQAVDEVTPDDASTTISTVSDATGEIDDYNIESPAAIADTDIVNVVHVGVRYVGGASSSNDSIVLRVKATSGGTVEESSNIRPNSTVYRTNANSDRNYPLTLYDLPGSSTIPWTKTTLETAQIGVRKSADSTNGVIFSTLWMLVDYTPDPNIPSGEVIDYYPVEHGDGWAGVGSDTDAMMIGQSFEAPANFNLTAVRFRLGKWGSPTGNARAELYAHTGTFGSSSLPTGSPLATSDDLDVSTIPNDNNSLAQFTWQNFTFSTPYELQAGTRYVIVYRFTGGNSSNHTRLAFDTTSPTHPGNQSYYDGSWNTISAYDVVFSLYGEEADTSQNATATPEALTAAFSVPAVIVTAKRNVTTAPNVLAATFSLPAVTVQTSSNVTVTPDVLTATLSLQQPTISTQTNVTATPDVLSAGFSLPAPAVATTRNVTVAPAVLTATFSLPQPTISTKINVTVTPDVLSATFSLPAVSVGEGEGITAAPSVLEGMFSLPAPTVATTRNVTVTPDALTATFSLPAPVISTQVSVTVTPSALSASFSVPDATVTTTQSTLVSVDVLTASLAVQDVTISTTSNVTVTPDALSATFELLDVAVSSGGNITVLPTVLEAAFSVPDVTVSTVRQVTVTPNALSAAFSLPAVSVTGNATVTPDVLSTAISLPDVTVSTAQNVTITPDLLTASFSLLDVQVAVDATANPDVLEVAFSLQQPTITATRNALITPDALSATFSLPQVTIATDSSVIVTPDVLETTFSVLSPTVRITRGLYNRRAHLYNRQEGGLYNRR